MRDELLPSPGFIPSGHRLRSEVTKAISYVETMAGLKGGFTEQAKSLTVFLDACKAAVATFIEVVLPTYVSSAILAASPTKLTITLSEGLDPAYVPAAGSFVSSPAKTFSSVAIVGNTVVLTATTAFAAGATTIAYTAPGAPANGLRDTSGNLLATFAAQSVTNGVV